MSFTQQSSDSYSPLIFFFFSKAEAGIRGGGVTGFQPCPLPIPPPPGARRAPGGRGPHGRPARGHDARGLGGRRPRGRARPARRRRDRRARPPRAPAGACLGGRLDERRRPRPPGRGAVRRLALPVGLVAAAVVLVLGVLAAVGSLPSLNPFASEERDRSGPVVLRSIAKLSEYRAATANLQVV